MEIGFYQPGGAPPVAHTRRKTTHNPWIGYDVSGPYLSKHTALTKKHMTKPFDWLVQKVPGFARLSAEERDAIGDFSLLWSLFEFRVLDANGSAQRICDAVEDWRQHDTLAAEAYGSALSYFRQRYFAHGQPTHHFAGLRLRGHSDREPMVRAVLDGSDDNAADGVATCLIVVYRYRNNLFHGPKWKYELQGQLENFKTANALLITALEHHGQLGDP